MAAAKSTPKIPFDTAKFETMVEPLAIRIERLTGNARTPIPLPDSDDPNLPQGTGWTKELIRGLEQWLVTEWSGGGLYEFSLTDSSPQPLTMKWSSWYDPRDYKPLIPPPLRDAQQQAQAAQVIPFAQPQPPQVRPMSAFPHGLPSHMPSQYPQQPQQPQPYYGMQPQYQMPPPPPVGTHAYSQWRDEAGERRREDELRLLRERDQQREREAMEAKHKAEIERIQTAAMADRTRHDNSINELRSMIASLAQTLTSQATQNKPNVELEEMKRKLEEQAREREAERRDSQLREMIKAMNENTQRQIEMITRQLETQALAAREAANNRPDQLVMMMQEQARQSADALKEMARTSAENIRSLQGFMMTPQAMFEMASRQTQATDAVTERIGKQYGSVIELQTKVMENALAMQPQGASAIDVVRDGVQGLKDMVERYTGSRTAEQRINANAQVEIARAQAAAIAAQAGGMAQQQTVYAPPAPEPQQQLAGTPANANGAAAAQPGRPVERFGRTDQEWFGPAMGEVQELRIGVARFIESLEQKPPRLDKDGQPDGVAPDQCAVKLIQAVQFLVQRQIPVGAVVDLLMFERYDDFFAVLLPDAPKAYRDDAKQAFVEIAQKLQGVTEEELQEMQDGDDGDDGGDDDGSDQDGAPNGKTPAAAQVNKTGKPTVIRRTTTTH